MNPKPNTKRSLRWTAVIASVGFLSMGIHSCDSFGLGSVFMVFKAPLLGQLSLPAAIELELNLSHLVDRDSPSCPRWRT